MSSSGHVALVPQLLGWRYAALAPEVRKSFEVAAHAGAAVALAWLTRAEPRRCDVRAAALTTLPPALAGLALERAIETRLGSVRQLAVAQIAAGAALALADLRPAERLERDAGALDHLAVGAAQAVALVPGVSRMGAALTAARLLGFRRDAAARIARRAALPVLAGACGLKGLRLASSRLPRGLGAPFAAGASASLAASLAAAPLARAVDRSRTLAPFAAYRIALGAAVLIRGRAD